MSKRETIEPTITPDGRGGKILKKVKVDRKPKKAKK